MDAEDGPCLEAILDAKAASCLLRFDAPFLFRRTPLCCSPHYFHVPGRNREPRDIRPGSADRASHRAGLAERVRVSTVSDMPRRRRGLINRERCCSRNRNRTPRPGCTTWPGRSVASLGRAGNCMYKSARIIPVQPHAGCISAVTTALATTRAGASVSVLGACRPSIPPSGSVRRPATRRRCRGGK